MAAATFIHLGCGAATPSARWGFRSRLSRPGLRSGSIMTPSVWAPLSASVSLSAGHVVASLQFCACLIGCRDLASAPVFEVRDFASTLFWVGAETVASAPGLVSRLLRLHLSCGVKALSLRH